MERATQMLEVCVDTVQGALIAVRAGANRIELCSALELGGVTPSGPFISTVRRSVDLPLIVLIRSRAGDFVFGNRECELMIEEAKLAIELGADGIAIGGLLESHELDLSFLRSVVQTVPKCQWVMHRAFDHVPNPVQALEDLVDIGFTRILTSGGRMTAIEGVSALKSLVDSARGRIEILPAGGINADNALNILTGCCTRVASQLHGSFRQPLVSGAGYSLPDPVAIRQTMSIIEAFRQRHCN